jgi:hypothetical protein
MKIFHCGHCGQSVFFENYQCIRCGRSLAYLPDARRLASLEPADGGLWRSPAPEGALYRRCSNYDRENVCNWAVAADDPNPLCLSCRLTRVIPDLRIAGNKEAWYRMETAKRRLVYSLLGLGLPVEPKTSEADAGLAFEFLADVPGSGPALTGHSRGVITLNLAEADDAQREHRRSQLHEPYRTLLGHFRHEIGHYYWDRLIDGTGRLEGFRRLFGDEREDYAGALRRYYGQGPGADWVEAYISTYAGSHPWEDWAESWAHYLHMVDALETAGACGLALNPRHAGEPALKADPSVPARGGFDRMIADWYPLTYVLNNLNRSLGLADGYPFVLCPAVVEKLRFVHDTVAQARIAARGPERALRPAGAS